jgi:hypothetical protein
MAGKKSHRVGKKRSGKKRKSSRKMPDHILGHFAARAERTIALARKRGITPRLLPKKRRK